MISICDFIPHEKISGRMNAGDTIGCWESIQPKNGIPYKVNKDHPWDVWEGEHTVGTPSAILHGANVALNVRNMFICRTGIELREGAT